MNKLYYKLFICISFFSLFFLSPEVKAQNCNGCLVDSVWVNLSANPDSVWTRTKTRSGACLGQTGCIMFFITLHPGANEFGFASSNAPPGNGNYHINCNPVGTSIGTPLCVAGMSSFTLIFCKTGGNSATYTLSSSRTFSASADFTVQQGCTGTMTVEGLNKPSIVWNSIFPGASGAYNSWLSCTSACDTTYITPPPAPATFPPYIDYVVSGTATGCASGTSRDTVRVYIVPGMTAEITPVNAYICSGSTITLTANATGGAPPYSYLWNNGATTQSITVPAGMYNVQISDTTFSCPAMDTVQVIQSTEPSPPIISSNSPVCAGSTLNLTASTITGANYFWTGPNGFASSLQNPSIPSVTSTHAGTYSCYIVVAGCPSQTVTTTVSITPIPIAPIVSNNGPLCEGQSLTLTASGVTGATYNWTGPNGYTGSGASVSIASVTVANAGTYSATATVNSCTGPAGTTTVVINAAPVAPVATSNSPVCVGQTLNLFASTITGATYSWTGPNGFTSTDQNPIISSITIAGTGNYSVTASVGGCVGPAGTVAVTVNPIPLAPTATNSGPICVGQTLTLTASGVSGAIYNWTGPGGYTATGASVNITNAQATHTGTYSATATVNGCTGPAGTTNSIVSPEPSAPAAGSNSPVCVGQTINLTASTITGATYNWTGPNGFTSTIQNPSIANAILANAGTYSVTATVGGCAGPAGTVSVTVNPIPVAPTAGSNSPVCVGQSINLTASTITGATYSWTGPNSFVSTLQNPAIAGATIAHSGTYSVTATVGGCTGPAGTVSVIVEPIPVAPTVGSNSPVCVGQAINLTASTITGATYSWTGPNSFTSALQNPIIPSATLSNAGTYSVTATVNGCAGPAGSISVTVNPIPVAPTATSNSPVCVGQTLNLFASAITGATYSWTGPNGFTSLVQNPTIASVTTTASGTYSVTAAVGGCAGPAGTVSVTVNPIPLAPTATNSGPICAGQTLTLTASVVAGATYNWTGPGGYTASGASVSITNAQSTHSGTYSVTATVNGCTGPAGTTNAVVNPIPLAPSTSNNGPICELQTLTLTASGIVGAIYNWTGPGGYTASGASVSIASATLANAGTYSVTATVNGCTGPAGTTNVTINPSPIAPTASNTGPVCAGQTITLNATGVAGAVYNWTGPGGYVATGASVSITNSQITQSGTYSVTATVSGCTGPAGTTNVVVNPIPATPTANNNGPLCEGQTLTITASGVTGAVYNWSGPGGYTASGASVSIASVTVSNAGTYSVTATVNGCTGPAGTTSVIVNPTPTAPQATSNSAICAGQTLNLFASIISGATYNWSGPNSFSSTGQNPTIANATSTASGIYSVTATVGSCTGPAGTVTVTVNSIPAAPTATSNSPVCEGSTITLSASGVSGATYNWTGPNGYNANGATQSITSATLAQGGTYSVSATVNGCTGSAGTVNVIVNPTPVPPTANGVTICAGNTATLTASSPSGGTIRWYTALTGGTLLATGSSFTTPVLNVTTTYFVQTSVNSCPSSRTAVTVTVDPIPVAPTAAGTTICQGNTATLIATAPGGNYEWYDAASAGTLLSSGASYTTPVLIASTTYYVQTTVNGCTSSRTAVIVTVTPTDDPSFSYTSGTYCITGTNGTPSISGGFTGTFTATPAGLVFVSTSTGEINVGGSALNTYTVTFTTNGPCPDSESTSITITNAPDANFSYSTPFCEFENNPLPTFPVGASAGVFSASPGGMNFENTSTGEINLQTSIPGTYTVTNTIVAAGGCPATSATSTVTIDQAATANAGTDINICAGQSASISGSIGGSATSFTWSGGTGIYSSTTASNITYTPSIAEESAGFVNLILTTNNPAGPCNQAVDTVTVFINPIPVAPTANGTTICEGLTANLTATAPGGTYGWYDSATAGNLLGTGSSFTTPVLLTTTTYYAQTTVNGCEGPRTAVQVIVDPTPAAPTAAGVSICQGQSTSLSATAPGGDYNWYDAPAGNNIHTGSNYTTPNLNITTTYYVTSTINGCEGPETAVTVTVNPYPVTPTAANQTICEGTTATLIATAPGGTYQWYNDITGGTLLSTGSSYTTPVLTSNTTYYVQTTVNGCSSLSRTSVTVTVTPLPVAPTAANETTCYGQSAILTATAPGGTYGWYSSGGTLLGTGNSFTTPALTVNTTYNVSTIVNGCEGPTSAVTVTVIPLDDPSFNYSPSTYCITGTDPTPTITGGFTGEFSATPAGLNFSSTITGEINLSASVLGTYTVTYTTDGPCPNTATQTITITNAPDATFSYTTPVCQFAANILPLFPTGSSAGVFSATPSGLVFVSTSTGEINLNTSTPGTYIVTNFIAAQGGCAAASEDFTITIQPAPTANAGGDITICAGQTASLNGSFGGSATSASWTGNGNFSPSVLDMNATYTPTSAQVSAGQAIVVLTTGTSGGVCQAAVDTVLITINIDNASFAYPSGTVCITGVYPVPTTFGGVPGTFTSSPAGLVFTNSSTGEVDLSQSSLGTYIITFTTAGPCPNSSTQNLTITTAPDASFSYDEPFCSSDANSFPIFPTGASAGVFSSSPAGLTFVSTNTGEISLSASTFGTYTITNYIAPAGGCAQAQETFSVTIFEGPTVDATAAQTQICEGDQVQLTGIFGGSASSITWSGGTASFTPSATDLNVTYTPTVGDISNGSVTFYLTTDNPTGPCDAAIDSVTVIINPSPIVNAGTPQTICEGETLTLNGIVGGSATGGIWSGSGSFSSTSDLNAVYTPSAAEITAGSANLTLTTVGPCPSATDDVLITIDPSAIANAGSNQTVCEGSTVNLSGSIGGSATTGTWSSNGDGTFSPSINDLNAIYTPGLSDISAGSVILTLSTDEPSGPCIADADQITITIDKDDATFSYSSGTFCVTGSNAIPVVLSGASGIFSSTPAGLVFVSTTTGEIDVAASALDTYLVTFITNGTCSDTAQATVTITNAPDATFSYVAPICQGIGSLFPDFPIGSSAGVFSATPTGVVFVDPVSGEIDLLASTAGVYTITNTIAASGGCALANHSTLIEIFAAPVADAGTDLIVCEGTTQVQLNGSVSGNSFGTWSTLGSGSFTDASQMNTDYLISAQDELDGIVILLLEATSNSGCGTSNDTVVITIQELPVLNAGNDTIVCSNNAEILLYGIISGGAGTGIWSVTGGSGSFDNDTSMNAIYTPGASDIASGSIYIVLSATNACMPVSDSLEVQFTPAPVVEAGSDITICNNDQILLIGTVSVSSGGVWSSNGSGTFMPGDSSLTGEYIPSASDLAAGSVIIYLESYGNGDCLAEVDSFTVTFGSSPLADFNTPVICSGIQVSFTDASSIDVSNWEWNFDDGNFASTQNPNHVFTQAGTYNVMLVVANNFGCTDTIIKTVTVNSSPDASFSFVLECGNSDVEFTDNSSINSGIISSWNWSFGDNGNSTLQNPTHSYVSTESYNVTLVITSDSGCVATVNDSVNIEEPFVGGFAFNAGCSGLTALFSDTSSAPGTEIASWAWSFGDGGTSAIENPSHTYLSAATYNVSLIVTTLNGCTDTVSSTVMVSGSPLAGFNVSQAPYYSGEQITFTDNSTGATIWNWNFDHNNSSATSQNTTYQYPIPGTYTVVLTVSNSQGCADSTEVILTVVDKGSTGDGPVAIPNAFTPNGDGKNDILFVRGGPFVQLEFRVFNEWGNLIFMTNNQSTGWDGTINGVKQPAGVYVYTVVGKTTEDQDVRLFGDVTLIR
ncbi:MAG: PKD domain-containing protein [Bacteroidota bacterium]|nr:PKD domain-containing protein [Bacteroidota bacterium]